jgi:hypothetical protein
MTRPIDPAVREQEILAARRASSDVAARAPTGPVPDANGVTVDLDLASTISRAPALDVASTVAAGCVLRERYVIEEKLGTGGKGTVFKALDRYRSSLPEFRHYVALKILHAGRDCSEETIKSLRRELECGQLLSHRNIVNVFELDRDGDVVFFTMELLDGELLSDVLGRMRPAALQPGQAWQIVRQLGAGLEHAHERGIVHGDLKPRNIMITREGEVRILDFGTARNGARTPPGSPQPGSAPVSATPAYASCEMLEGRAIDPRDDLYALACISYELLSGAHPFAHRPATLARDFGIKASRPAGLTGGQWRTLLAGLSWHRAGRSMSVHTFVRDDAAAGSAPRRYRCASVANAYRPRFSGLGLGRRGVPRAAARGTCAQGWRRVEYPEDATSRRGRNQCGCAVRRGRADSPGRIGCGGACGEHADGQCQTGRSGVTSPSRATQTRDATGAGEDFGRWL